MRNNVYRLVALTALALLCQGVPIAPSEASPSSNPGAASDGLIGIQLLEAPVVRRNDPRALMYIVDHVHPGTTIRRRIKVVNHSGRREHFELYPGAATLKGGKFVVFPERIQNEVSRWVTLDRSRVDVPAGGEGMARVAVRIPKQASRGERYGVVWGEVTAKPDRTHTLGMTSRVGIRIYLDVGPGGEPPSDFRIDRLVAARTRDGLPQIVARVHNTGGRALDIGGALWLSDGPGGTSAGPFEAEQAATLAPGEDGTVPVLLSKGVPKGPWKARLRLRSGMVQRTVTARVTFPDSPGQSWAVRFGQLGWLGRAALLGGTAISLTTLVVVLLRYRRARRIRREL